MDTKCCKTQGIWTWRKIHGDRKCHKGYRNSKMLVFKTNKNSGTAMDDVTLFVPKKLRQNGHFNRWIDFTKTCCKPFLQIFPQFWDKPIQTHVICQMMHALNLTWAPHTSQTPVSQIATLRTHHHFYIGGIRDWAPGCHFKAPSIPFFFGWHMLSSPIFVHQNGKTMRLGDQTPLGNQPIHQNLLTLWVCLKIMYPSPFLPILGIAVGSRWLCTALYSHAWANQNQPCSKLDW